MQQLFVRQQDVLGQELCNSQDSSWPDSVCQKFICTSDKQQTIGGYINMAAKGKNPDCLLKPKNKRLVN